MTVLISVGRIYRGRKYITNLYLLYVQIYSLNLKKIKKMCNQVLFKFLMPLNLDWTSKCIRLHLSGSNDLISANVEVCDRAMQLPGGTVCVLACVPHIQ